MESSSRKLAETVLAFSEHEKRRSEDLLRQWQSLPDDSELRDQCEFARERFLKLRLIAHVIRLVVPSSDDTPEGITADLRASFLDLYSSTSENAEAVSSVSISAVNGRNRLVLDGTTIPLDEIASVLTELPFAEAVARYPELADHEITPAQWESSSRFILLLVMLVSA